MGDRLEEELAKDDPYDLKNILTQDDLRKRLTLISEDLGEWQGIPVPVRDYPLILEDRHPMKWAFSETWKSQPDEPETVEEYEESHHVVLEAAEGEDAQIVAEYEAEWETRCSVDDVQEDLWIRNQWIDHERNYTVTVMQTGGKITYSKEYRTDQSMKRLMLGLRSMHASDAWELDAETKAQEKLCGMINEQQWRTYCFTGQFAEGSERSGLTYLFRKLRPTVVMTPREKWGRGSNYMRPLTVLCLHPIGYYLSTWAGSLTPTDDVIAHLLFMRGDEAGFWGKANQHDIHTAEAGV